ncbi:hypothetical protein AMTRI_Chr08g164370 [Amborella trichopoda]
MLMENLNPFFSLVLLHSLTVLFGFSLSLFSLYLLILFSSQDLCTLFFSLPPVLFPSTVSSSSSNNLSSPPRETSFSSSSPQSAQIKADSFQEWVLKIKKTLPPALFPSTLTLLLLITHQALHEKLPFHLLPQSQPQIKTDSFQEWVLKIKKMAQDFVI